MFCDAELKYYFNEYRKSLLIEERTDSKLDIGSCGDEKLIEVMQSHLGFGRLAELDSPCKEATAIVITVLLSLLAGMYRVKVVPTLTSIYLDSKPMMGYDNMWLLFRPGTIVYVKQTAFWERTTEPNWYEKKRAADLGVNYGEGDNEYSACVVASWKC